MVSAVHDTKMEDVPKRKVLSRVQRASSDLAFEPASNLVSSLDTFKRQFCANYRFLSEVLVSVVAHAQSIKQPELREMGAGESEWVSEGAKHPPKAQFIAN